jgi:hypothetical protein
MTTRPVPKAPSPATLAKSSIHPIKVPVVAKLSEADLAAAALFGDVVDGKVVVKDGDNVRPVGDAAGERPLESFVAAYYELKAAVERFQARLDGAELSVKDIDRALTGLDESLAEPAVVGDLSALRDRLATVKTEAAQVRAKIDAARLEARDKAVAAREALVSEAEAIVAKDESAIHWKNDTARMRELLDEWKTAQRDHARIPKDHEKKLWKRFSHARTVFDKTRRTHFAQLDKDNSAVASRKEDLVKRAEELSTSTDWERTARAYRDLMNDWKTSGRGRRSVDDALWRRFQDAQEKFFTSRRAAAEAEDDALAGNVGAKEAAVALAEGILPVKDLAAAKAALRTAQDQFDAAGEVPRKELGRLNARMAAVEKVVRDAEDKAWNSRNPELEARLSGATAQLQAAIDALQTDLDKAQASGDKRAIKDAKEALAARKAWLKQLTG